MMNAGSGRSAIRRLFGRWRLRVWILLAFIMGIGLGWAPLFNVLGYELAIAAAVFAAICGLDLGAAVARELQWMQEPGISRATYPGRTLAVTTVASAGLAVAVIIVPALIAAIRGLWIPTCDWSFGLKAYLAMPFMTAALAGALGHAIGVAAGSRPEDPPKRQKPRKLIEVLIIIVVIEGVAGGLGLGLATGFVIATAGGLGYSFLRFPIKPHRSTVLALALPLVLLAGGGVYQFYAAPPVFTYNAIIGYFPGNLYDENVQLGMPLFWSRVEQVFWVIAIVALVATRLDVPRFRASLAPRPATRRIGAFAIAIVATVAGLAMHLSSSTLGYKIDGDTIAAALGGRIETEHFIIHYSRTADIERDIAMIAADHELRYAQVVAQLGAAPEGKLRSYYFSSRDQKARLIGAKDVEMAKPWRREIYLEHRGFPHGSLRHEIAHAVASAFGDPIFGVAARRVVGIPVFISPGLIEGLAVAVDWPAGYERLTPHESVRAMQAMGMTPTINELLSLRFLTVSSARSYTTAGSFLRYLLDQYGASALRSLYESGGDFATAYGKPVGMLEAEWRTMIAAIVLPPDVIEGTRERFRAGSVFARPCPHANAARRERAAHAYAGGNRKRAVKLMRDVCKDAPDEPRYKLELGDFLVGGEAPDRVEAIATWTALANSETVTSSLRADAIDRLARQAAANGDLAKTAELIARARALPVDANAKRQLEAQWLALGHEGAAGPALRGYFFAPPGPLDAQNWALLATLAEPTLGLGHYVVGLQKTNFGEWQASAEALDQALTRGLPSVAFTKNAARKLLIAAYRAGDLPRVERAIATLRGPGMAQTDQLLADDWSQRLHFAATGRLSK